jgi:hypothetical protein
MAEPLCQPELTGEERHLSLSVTKEKIMRSLILVLTLFALAHPAIAQTAGGRCADAKGYPLGRWTVSAVSDSDAKFSTFVTFTHPRGGTWLPATGTGTFNASPAPMPGAEVTITLCLMTERVLIRAPTDW